MSEFEYHEREAGIYEAVFVSITVKQDVADFQSGELGDRWIWTFQDVNDDSTVGVIDAMTAPRIGTTTKALSRRIVKTLFGREPQNGDDPTSRYGTVVNVVYGPNQNGKLAITDVLPVKSAKG